MITKEQRDKLERMMGPPDPWEKGMWSWIRAALQTIDELADKLANVTNERDAAMAERDELKRQNEAIIATTMSFMVPDHLCKKHWDDMLKFNAKELDEYTKSFECHACVKTQRDAARAALESMVRQFAYWSERAGGYTTGGLSALEEAFDALGWDNPHQAPEARCDEPGCMNFALVGTPTPDGYRRTCPMHAPKIERNKRPSR